MNFQPVLLFLALLLPPLPELPGAAAKSWIFIWGMVILWYNLGYFLTFSTAALGIQLSLVCSIDESSSKICCSCFFFRSLFLENSSFKNTPLQLLSRDLEKSLNKYVYWIHHLSSILFFIMSQTPYLLFFKRFYLFIFKGGERENERERNSSVWLPLMRPLLGAWTATQACALTGN